MTTESNHVEDATASPAELHVETHYCANMVAEPGRHDQAETITLEKIWGKTCAIEAMLAELIGKRVDVAESAVESSCATLQKLERQAQADENPETDADDVQDLQQVIKAGREVRGVVSRWVSEKGYGFVTVGTTKVFVDFSAIQGSRTFASVRELVMLRIILDEAQGAGKIKADRLWSMPLWGE